jgi:chromatin remodeling complex protein RSC6
MAVTKKTTKMSKPSTKKSSSKKVETPEPVVETPVVEPPVESQAQEDNYDAEFTEVKDALRSALDIIKSLNTKVNALEKRVARDRKVMNKKMKGRVKRVVDPNKPPSGFAKPGPVSDELSKFLGLSKGELIARTEVTKRITKYCQENDLQKKEDKRTIHADKGLTKLLRLKKGDELTFFNLQKYMKVHYPNKEGVFIHA